MYKYVRKLSASQTDAFMFGLDYRRRRRRRRRKKGP